MSGNSANQGSSAKSAAKQALSPLIGFSQRYGRVRALSTARSCQGIHHFDRLFALPRLPDWASVPPPQNSPIRIFHDHLVPGDENRPASWPRLGCDGDSLRIGAAVRPAGPCGPCDPCSSRRTARRSGKPDGHRGGGNWALAWKTWTRRPRRKTVGVPDPHENRRQAAEDKKVEDSDESKKRLAFARNRLSMADWASQGKAATTDEAMKRSMTTPPSR